MNCTPDIVLPFVHTSESQVNQVYSYDTHNSQSCLPVCKEDFEASLVDWRSVVLVHAGSGYASVVCAGLELVAFSFVALVSMFDQVDFLVWKKVSKYVKFFIL